MTPGTDAFTERWKEIAAADPKGFAKDQHDYIQENYYDVQMRRLKNVGIDLSERGPAVQDAVWSSSVQYGGLTRSLFKQGLAEAYGNDYKLSELTDEQIVTAVQDFKHANVHKHFEKTDPGKWDSLRDRALEEKATLVGLTRYDHVNRQPDQFQGMEYQQVSG